MQGTNALKLGKEDTKTFPPIRDKEPKCLHFPKLLPLKYSHPQNIIKLTSYPTWVDFNFCHIINLQSMPSPHNINQDHEAHHPQSHPHFQSQSNHQPHHHRTYKKRLVTHQNGNTNIFIWLAAILCTILAIGVVIGGVVVFVGYIIIHPRVPTISIASAHLDLFRNDYAGLLQTQINIIVMAQNGNFKAHATFSNIKLKLGFQGQGIAYMVADPFDVPKNSSKFLNYVVQSSSIPLTPDQIDDVDETWKRNVVGFDLKGDARTQWRIGPFGSFKFGCKLECLLRFHPLNGSYIPSRCTSQSK